MSSQDCVFCQLMQDKSQLMIIEETENFYSWLEFPEPRARGQANIVSKDHVQKITDLDNDQYMEMAELVRNVTYRARNGLESGGVTVAYHENQVGGQMIDHLYIQVIPRYESDENSGTPVTAIFPKKEELSQNVDAAEEVLEEYKSASPDFEEKVEKHPDAEKSASKTQKTINPEEDTDEDGEDDSGSDSEYSGSTFEWM